jgi:hypothetical protein
MLEALPGSGDKAKRLARANELQKKTQAALAKLSAYSKKWANSSVGGAYNEGVRETRARVKDIKGKLNAAVGDFHAEALALMAGQTYSRMAEVIAAAGRRTLDVYNEAKLRVHMFDAMAGMESVDKLHRRLLDEMVAKGITGFVDKAGREWNMTAYTKMLATTAVNSAYREAAINEAALSGHDLVIVSGHGTECEKCKPWEREVLSISGESKKYFSLADARDSGLFHPRCAHSVTVYHDIHGFEEERQEEERRQQQEEAEKENIDAVEPTKTVDEDAGEGDRAKEREAMSAAPTPEERIENAFANFEDDQKALMVGAFKDSPPEIIDLLETYKTELKFDMPASVPRRHARAYYQPGNQTVVIQKGYGEGTERALRHEVGHFLDNIVAKKTGNSLWLSSTGDMLNALDGDRNQLRGRGKAKAAFRDKMIAAMKPGEKYYNNAAVSDIFSSMSGGEISGNWYHAKSYYTNPENGRAEVFANLHQLEAAKDTEAIEFVRGFFPETVAAFEKWLYNK